MAVTPATYAPYAVAEMGEDVCAPAVCGAGVWYAVGRYNIRESIIGNLFVIYLVFYGKATGARGQIPRAPVVFPYY